MTAFERASYEVAEAFLSTVVVVDDRAEFIAPEQVTDLTEPGDLDTTSAESQAIVEPAIERPKGGSLNAGELSAAFAEMGLVCGIINPQAGDQKKAAILSASRNADVVVLDWQMNDEGDLATKIITEMLAADEASGGRLRLVVVYTAQDVSTVSASLESALTGFQISQDRHTFEKGSSRVIVLSKAIHFDAEGTPGAGVTEADLPKRLVEDFAKFSGGLLPNATLAAISGVRRHTHRMLGRFVKDLDGPLLTHRALLAKPGDAESFATSLIMAELDAQVPIDQIVSDYLNAESIKQYLEHQMEGGLEPFLMLDKSAGVTEKLDLAAACELIEKGFSSLAPKAPDLAKRVGQEKKLNNFKDSLRANLHDRLYLLTTSDLAVSRRNHDLFAERSKLKRDLGSVDLSRPPAVRLGTLLRGGGAYWICLTPLCDSSRLKHGDRLLFAELTEDQKAFDLVVPDGSQSLRLKVGMKRTNLASFSFIPDQAGYVKPTAEGTTLQVESLDDNPSGTRKVVFQWLAELKPMHAQRLVQRFAANLARVGLDDFEWHRMQMGGEA